MGRETTDKKVNKNGYTTVQLPTAGSANSFHCIRAAALLSWHHAIDHQALRLALLNGKLTYSGENTHYRLLDSFHQQRMTYRVDEQPVLGLDSIPIEEKCGADKTLAREIGCEICDPHKHVEASTSLEHEESSHLLCKETDDDNMPLYMRPVLGCSLEPKLEQDQTKHGDCAVTVVRTLVPQYAGR
jgi:hypothetical protein